MKHVYGVYIVKFKSKAHERGTCFLLLETRNLKTIQRKRNTIWVLEHYPANINIIKLDVLYRHNSREKEKEIKPGTINLSIIYLMGFIDFDKI